MSDGLSALPRDSAAAPQPPPPPRGRVLRPLGEWVAVVAVFAGVGAVSGWLWETIWSPPMGTVIGGQWGYDDYENLGKAFDGTAWFVILGFSVGVVLGVAAALLARRSAVVTLVAVAVGSLLAAYLCHRVGLQLSPPDPNDLAASQPDGTRLPAALEMPGRSPYAFWPLGALLGLAVTYVFSLVRASAAPLGVKPPVNG